MGSVWRAEHLALHAAVAVKLMDPAIAETPEGAERFRREAQAAASLRSTHVVQVLDYGVEDGTPYLVMELLHGESLAACLEREVRLSPARTLAIMTQVCRAITRAHGANIVHRDLKPDNIFLITEDDQEVVKVLDFGIAKTDSPSFGDMKTRTGMVMGTPHYMSPEQTEGKKTVDFRTDLWAIAVITCECLTGVQPFRGETWGELVLNVCARPIPVPSTFATVPLGFDVWFQRATDREPLSRFSSAQEMLTAFRHVVEGTYVNSSGQIRFGSTPDLPIGDAPTMELKAAISGNPSISARVHPTSGALAGKPGAAVVTAVTSQREGSGEREIGQIPLKRSGAPVLLAAGVLGIAVVIGAFVIRGARDTFNANVASVLPSVEALGIADSSSLVRIAVPLETSNRLIRGDAQPPSNLSGSEPNLKGVSGSTGAKTSAPLVSNRVSVSGTLPASSTARVPPTSSASFDRTLGKAMRCYTDPFTGTVRLDGTGQRPSQVQTFTCKQNPFTGQYQKL
jgi:serine/threonine-protein kinase